MRKVIIAGFVFATTIALTVLSSEGAVQALTMPRG